ncbi:MAG: type pilus biosis protein PilO [Pseudomonadota bacterium]
MPAATTTRNSLPGMVDRLHSDRPGEAGRNPGQWPLPVRLLTLLAVCLTAALGYYLIVLAPALTELETKRNEEIRLKQSLAPYLEKAARLSALEQQQGRVMARLHQARHRLARHSDLPYLVSELARLGKQRQLQLELAKTGGQIPDESFDLITTELRLRGGYPAYLEFLEDIAELPYMTTLHDIRIQQTADALLIMATLRTYVHKETAP